MNAHPIAIMIVDDQTDVRRALKGLLQMLQDCYVAAEAENGQDALRLAPEIKPDIILMDLNMPEMDGFETTRKLREIVPDAKVIILTQHDSPEVVDAARSARAAGFVAKTKSRELPDAIAAVRKGVPYFPS